MENRSLVNVIRQVLLTVNPYLVRNTWENKNIHINFVLISSALDRSNKDITDNSIQVKFSIDISATAKEVFVLACGAALIWDSVAW